jgi:hypothetical protein
VQTSNVTESTTLIERGNDARYVSTGQIVYAVGGQLFARAWLLAEMSADGQKKAS